MKKRFFYIISFLLIFCIEVLIALYVRDNFIRPYVGDMLVVVLVYSFVRIFLPTGIPRMPFYVFLFACFVEVLQYFRLVETLGITNRAARIILGSTFDWADIACYAVGCVFIVRAYWQELIAMRHPFFVFRLIGLKVLSFHVPEPYYIVLAY